MKVYRGKGRKSNAKFPFHMEGGRNYVFALDFDVQITIKNLVDKAWIKGMLILSLHSML